MVILFDDRPFYFRATGDREIFEKFDGAIGLISCFHRHGDTNLCDRNFY
ncbi:MAG: hypothetical protein ACRC62_09905 [Microcoleus sp.]